MPVVVRKDAADAAFEQALSILPHGLQILGVLVSWKSNGQKPAWPAEVPAKAHGLHLLAMPSEDGRLTAWDMQAGHEMGPWKVAEPSEICAYASLDVALPTIPAQAAARLASAVSSLPEARFRFPDTPLVPSLADLEEGKVQVPWKPGSGCVVVELLAEGFGSDRCSNFVEFQCHLPAEHRIDFATYVPQDSAAPTVARCLLEAATQQLKRVADQLSAQGGKKDASLAVRCFLLEHVVCLQGTERQNVRQGLHQLLRLPQVPLLLPSAALPLAGQAGVQQLCYLF